MPFSPLTLTLSPKGRGDITFDKTGFRAGGKEEVNRRELNLFLESPRVQVLSMDEDTAEYYAKVFGDLKKKGRPIPTNDMWVAASAMQHGLWLASKDEHFQHVEGLLLLVLRR